MSDDNKTIAANVTDTGEVIAAPPQQISGDVTKQHNSNGLNGTVKMTSLMQACRRGDTSNVSSILASFSTSSNHNVLEVDTNGRTAMHHCSQCNQTQCARLLRDFSSSTADVSDFDGLSPLHIAIITGAQMMVRFLLVEAKANVNAADNEGHSLIHWATVVHNEEAIDLLASAGGDVNRRDPSDARPIHYASQARPPSPPPTSEEAVINRSRIKVSPDDIMATLKKLIALDAQCNVKDRDGRTPLMWAAASGNAEACKLLVTRGRADVTSVDNDGVSALHCAAAASGKMMMETLQVLVEMSTNNDHNSSSRKSGVDPFDANLCTPLFYTAATGNVQALAFLVSHGANVNHADKKNRTAAHIAAARGNVRIMNELISLGANVWAQSGRGELPLHEAVHSGTSEELIIILLTLRPDMVNARNTEGRTCLHMAASNNNVVLCKMLIKRGARVNDIYRNPRTEGRLNHLKFLTAYDCASALGYIHCAKTIKLDGGAPAEALLNVAATKIQRTARNWASKKSSRRGSPTSTALTSSSGDRASATSLSVTASPINAAPSHGEGAKQQKSRSDSIVTNISTTSSGGQHQQNSGVIVVGTVAMFKDPEDQRWHVTAPPLASRRTSLDVEDEGDEKLERAHDLAERRRSQALQELLAPLLAIAPTAIGNETASSRQSSLIPEKLDEDNRGTNKIVTPQPNSAPVSTKATDKDKSSTNRSRPTSSLDTFISSSTAPRSPSATETNSSQLLKTNQRREEGGQRHKSGAAVSSTASGKPVYELQGHNVGGNALNLELFGSEIPKPPLYNLSNSGGKAKQSDNSSAEKPKDSKDFLNRPCN